MISKSKLDVGYRLSVSNLQLQVILYYNVTFSILFALLMGAATVNKAQDFEYKIGIAILVPWCLVEVLRLYYGFKGNLTEKVPDLSTFLLISIFPQLPFVIFLAYIQQVKYPVDKILGSFMLLFLVIGFVLGTVAIRKLIQSQTSQFLRIISEEE